MKRKRMTSTQSAPLYARLIAEYYDTQVAIDASRKYPVNAVAYSMFVKMQKDTTPGARGYCYALALKLMPAGA